MNATVVIPELNPLLMAFAKLHKAGLTTVRQVTLFFAIKSNEGVGAVELGRVVRRRQQNIRTSLDLMCDLGVIETRRLKELDRDKCRFGYFLTEEGKKVASGALRFCEGVAR